ncbi:MAG TPA: hypothetical protein VFZ19_08310 [Solirubrobacterales bacterium]
MSKLRGPIFTALILVISLAIADAVLAPAPAPEQPDFIDAVFASRAVVAAIRIAIVFAALFVALSVTALIAQRRWLTRLGPVEVSEEVSNFRAEIQRLEEDLGVAHEVIEALEGQDAHTQQLVDREDL